MVLNERIKRDKNAIKRNYIKRKKKGEHSVSVPRALCRCCEHELYCVRNVGEYGQKIKFDLVSH